MSQYNDGKTTESGEAERRSLSPEATRALAEALDRRRAAEARIAEVEAGRAKEVDGRGGAEPVRFGDWEVKGIATDF